MTAVAETIPETADRLDVEQPDCWTQENLDALRECRDEENCLYCGQWVVEVEKRAGGAS